MTKLTMILPRLWMPARTDSWQLILRNTRLEGETLTGRRPDKPGFLLAQWPPGDRVLWWMRMLRLKPRTEGERRQTRSTRVSEKLAATFTNVGSKVAMPGPTISQANNGITTRQCRPKKAKFSGILHSWIRKTPAFLEISRLQFPRKTALMTARHRFPGNTTISPVRLHRKKPRQR